MLSSGALTQMQTVLNLSLPDTAAIGRRTEVSNGRGGVTVTYPTAATVACRVSPAKAGAREAVVNQAAQGRAEWLLTFPAGTVVYATDRITVGARVFEVRNDLAPRSYELSVQVVCLEVG